MIVSDPELRLQTIQNLGELNVPVTTGILIGIGETRKERLESLSERQDRLQDQEQSHGDLLKEATLQVTDSEDRLESISQQKNELSGKLTELDSRTQELYSRIIEGEKQLEDLRYQNSTAQSRLESLQQIQSHYEGFKDSVKIFMQLMNDNPEKKQIFGISGLPVSYTHLTLPTKA